MERGANKRQKHAGNTFFLVTRRKDGTNMLSGWFRVGWLRRWTTVLVINAEPGCYYHVRNLDARRSAGVFWHNAGPDNCDGRARGDGFTGSAWFGYRNHCNGMVMRKVQNGGR